MMRLAWLAVLALVAEVIVAAELPDELSLTVGDTRVLHADLRRAALGDGKVVSLSSPEPGQLLVIGEAAGVTTAQLWLRDGTRHRIRLVVTEDDPEALLAEVTTLIEGMPAIRARLAGGRILLEGSDAGAADRQRAADIAALHPGRVLDFVSRVGAETMIQFETRLVEVRRDRLQQLGVRWATTASGPEAAVAVGTGRAMARLAWSGALGSQLDLLEQQGLARTIAEPVLSCRSGGVARFISGGEIPLPVTDGLGATDVQYKEYGIILEVRPEAARTGPIAAEVDVELSQIDAAIRVRDFPGFIKRRSSTAINVMAGETIVIAGLAASESSSDRQGLPGLGRLPVAGRLFSSRRQQHRQTDLLVLITPRRVELPSAAPEAATTDQQEWARQLQGLLQEPRP
ncbi:MAG: pilus assembly protein N-terminal domain-containing protein [Steroidobacteraceae bacterium]